MHFSLSVRPTSPTTVLDQNIQISLYLFILNLEKTYRRIPKEKIIDFFKEKRQIR